MMVVENPDPEHEGSSQIISDERAQELFEKMLQDGKLNKEELAELTAYGAVQEGKLKEFLDEWIEGPLLEENIEVDRFMHTQVQKPDKGINEILDELGIKPSEGRARG